jgi:hypothetical protein
LACCFANQLLSRAWNNTLVTAASAPTEHLTAADKLQAVYNKIFDIGCSFGSFSF